MSTRTAETRSATDGSGRQVLPSGLSPWWLAAPVVVMLLALVAALSFSGAAAAKEVADPGALVRWGLPISEAVRDLALVATIGSLLLAVGVVPNKVQERSTRVRHKDRVRKAKQDGESTGTPQEHPLFTRLLQLAGATSVVWTVAAAVVVVFTYAEVSGVRLSASAAYTQQLISFVTDIPTGQALGVGVIVAAVVTTFVFGLRSLLGLLLTMALADIALVTMALNGHSAGGDDHMGAVNSLGLHLLGVCAWAGGLIALAWLSPLLAGDRSRARLPIGARTRRASDAQHAAQGREVPLVAVVLSRFSNVALWCFVLVLASGVINAAVRIGTVAQLTSAYGTLVIVKLVLTLALGVAGYVHRRAVIPALVADKVSGRRAVWQIIIGELAIMGGLIGVAVALGNSAPPVPEDLEPDASPARILTFYELPPEPTLANAVAQWRPDWLWVAIIVVFAVSYAWAIWKVRRTGGTWSPLRAISWFVGLALLFLATSGPVAVYARVLFSWHMVEHMSLTMIIPVFMVLGSPVTLLLKALEPRRDGTRGPREWILRLVHSTWGKIVTNPIFAAVNFAGSIVLFYFTPLLGFTLRTHVGHEFMMAHFLFTGYMFALVLVGQDPIPHRPAHFMRLVMLIATMAYHAFVGVAIMGMDVLLEASWFGNMGRDWGLSAIEDQQRGGALMWGIGELPTALLAVVVGIQWAIAGNRENRRVDREADRTDDAELKAYNEMMERLAEDDAQRR
ncbi:bifunctional copper resistance protein CopD/cytochrome c oxidase assembly protein [Kocuria sp. JC486]|uniref:cytochrome c oxidase assembly protein n=1 Tax=Kocuria sp. JC486 TaxID=1970736 RepID=UPI00141FA4E2|nr:cytochrome c oxidase assembly protein [Kocuria sp. JC486]NHU85055.1 bifunctional copper resistance protein CopD/cytochrome c oxidase assembly protein [Kocuria sp. JC486]